MTATDLHRDLMKLVHEEAANHFVQTDDGQCFNLFTFLESLESRLHTSLDTATARFEISPHEVARYLWCCLAIKDGDSPDGDTFRGVPVWD